MSKNQKVAFWSIFISFCVAATAVIYPQGAFENWGLGAALVLTASYLIVAFLVHWYVKTNANAIENWFK